MKRIIIVLTFLSIAAGLKAQQTDSSKKGAQKQTSADSLMNSMSTDDKHEDVIGAFKATRLIFSQTTQTVKKNNLNFLVIHRFGDVLRPFDLGRHLGIVFVGREQRGVVHEVIDRQAD